MIKPSKRLTNVFMVNRIACWLAKGSANILVCDRFKHKSDVVVFYTQDQF